MTPDSPIEDAPLEIGDWRPQNYADQYLGMTDLRTAFAQSLNSAAVRLQEQVGREQVIALARQLGITSPLPAHPSLALGGMEASLLELTAAYAAVRANAARVEPYVVRAVQAPGGVTFRERQPAPSNRDWLGQPMVDLLGEAVRTGTGKAAVLDAPVFGKTGTTQDYRDAWFIGFTEELVVGVWVGNDENAPMTGVTGSSLPAKIWRSFVAEALRPTDEAEPSTSDRRPPAEAIAGIPDVVDTATLRIEGGTVRLAGVTGLGGAYARDLAAYIGDRGIACRLTSSERYRCEVDGFDLAELVLRNGAGRATAHAAPALVEAQRKARDEARGIWSTPVLIRGH
jgi:membrane peptidoglycan carboxypeptidase